MVSIVNEWLDFQPTHHITIHLHKGIHLKKNEHVQMKRFVTGDRETYEKVYHDFITKLSKKIHTRSYWMRHREKIANYGFYQIGKSDGSPHFHIMMRKPPHISVREFHQAIDHICKKMKWIRDDLSYWRSFDEKVTVFDSVTIDPVYEVDGINRYISRDDETFRENCNLWVNREKFLDHHKIKSIGKKEEKFIRKRRHPFYDELYLIKDRREIRSDLQSLFGGILVSV